MDLRFLFLDLNSYFASVEQQLKPDLRGEPVIVVPVLTDATCAIAASYEAKAYGIKTGTLVGDAKRLCPRLKIVLADHRHYVEYHHRIREAMHECIPVSITASIDEFGAELMANERQPERAKEIARTIKASLRARVGAHIRASIGIAPNRYLAKIACDMQKPDGLTVLAAPDIEQRLRHLALRDLPGIGPRMEQRLWHAGIRTMPELLALAPKQMRAIWGSVSGEQMYYRLRGVEIPDAPTQKSTIGHSHVLAPAWRPPEAAFIVAQRLTLKAASRLRRSGYLARQMDLGVRRVDGATYAYRASLPAACDNHIFLKALRTLWDAMLEATGPAPCKKISIALHGLVTPGQLQPDLFATLDAVPLSQQKKRETLCLAIDRVNERYGRDTLVMGFLPRTSSQFSGTKIAFTRVPEVAEFYE